MAKNDRKYEYLGILYEDDENFDTQMFNLLQEKEVIYARHDKDIFEEDEYDDNGNLIHSAGDDKKPHIHYYVHFKNPCTLSAFAKRLGVKENMIEYRKKTVQSCLRYLIHHKMTNKYNYDADIVQSNDDKLMKKFHEAINDETPGGDHVMSIQDYIESQIDYVSMRNLGRYANSIGIWNYFMRYYQYIRDIVKEHNSDIAAKKYHIDNSYFHLEDNYRGLHNIYYAIFMLLFFSFKHV